MIFDLFYWTSCIFYQLGSSEWLQYFWKRPPYLELVIRISSWRVKYRSFTFLAKVSPEREVEFWTLGAGLSRSIVFAGYLDPAMQGKLSCDSGLMAYRGRQFLNLVLNVRSWWTVEWPAGCRNYGLLDVYLWWLHWLPWGPVPSGIPYWVSLWEEWGRYWLIGMV